MRGKNVVFSRMAFVLMLAFVLLMLGLWLFNMPLFTSTYRDTASQEMIASIREGNAEYKLSEQAILSSIVGDEELGYAEGDILGDLEDTGEDADANTVGLKGILRIPAISLEMPLISGASRSNLRFSLVYDVKSAPIGQEGNFVVFGHRMKKRGRHFNRLDEMRAGDTISVFIGAKEYVYTVDDIRPELPPREMRTLMALNTAGRRISLVTCTPLGKGTHRLVVMGELTDIKDAPPLGEAADAPADGEGVSGDSAEPA